MTTIHAATAQAANERSEAAAPLVHPQETTDGFDSQSGYREFLVSGIPEKIAFFERLYNAIDIRDRKNRTLSYNQCRSFAWFVRHKVTHEIRVASQRCGLRWCPLCMKTKRFIMKQSLIPWIKSHKKPKFITFTMKHSDDPLAEQLQALYDNFRKMRNSKLWKTHIKGGIWLFQLTKSETTNQWHPHIHVIANGRYLPHSDLCRKWYKITKTSNIVDIRGVRDPKKAADYVARYATAPANLEKLEFDDAIEVFDALAGRRMCGTFGNGKIIQLCPKKCPDADDWEDMGSFWQLSNKRWIDGYAAGLFFSWKNNTAFHGEKPPEVQEPPPQGDLFGFEPQQYEQMQIDWNNFYTEREPNDEIPF